MAKYSIVPNKANRAFNVYLYLGREGRVYVCTRKTRALAENEVKKMEEGDPFEATEL